MVIDIDHEDCETIHVDRNNVLNLRGHQGFDLSLGGVRFRFEDEEDALKIATAILKRLGYA